MIALTMYSRPGCHLCDEMKATIDRVAQSIPLTVNVIDISGDSELERRYGVQIPVLLVNGTRAAKYRIGEEELRQVLFGRMGGTSRKRPC